MAQSSKCSLTFSISCYNSLCISKLFRVFTCLIISFALILSRYKTRFKSHYMYILLCEITSISSHNKLSISHFCSVYDNSIMYIFCPLNVRFCILLPPQRVAFSGCRWRMPPDVEGSYECTEQVLDS